MHSKVWGKYLWWLLHTITYSFDEKYDQELTQKYVEIFYALPKVIPCPICRSHYKKRLAYAPVEKYLSSKDKFRSWLIDIHNNVNRGLGKPTISLSYANSLYLNKDNSLKYNYQNFIILIRMLSMVNQKFIDIKAVRKLIRLSFDVLMNYGSLKNAPYSYENIKMINNQNDMNKWIVEFDIEYMKNNNRKPYLKLNNKSNVVDYHELAKKLEPKKLEPKKLNEIKPIENKKDDKKKSKPDQKKPKK